MAAIKQSLWHRCKTMVAKVAATSKSQAHWLLYCDVDIAATLRHASAMPDTAPVPITFFDREAGVGHVSGTSLPHWRQLGVLYFVTFRMADSLPGEKLETIRRERAEWLSKHPEPHTPALRREYNQLFSQRIEHWIDAGHGSLFLARRDAGSLVEAALHHFHKERYRLDTYAVAANHVHVVLTPLNDHSLSGILRSWKGYTARRIADLPEARTISTFPTIWQKESFDHIVRSPQSLDRFREYILSHPTCWKGRPK